MNKWARRQNGENYYHGTETRIKINFRVSGKTLNTPTLNYRSLRRGR